jgi:glycosyltransferase involved in cell wall biosynthesis
LLIAGAGPLWRVLDELTRELGLSAHVSFTGEFEDLAGIMAQTHVVVVASGSESQAMPLTEAMAYGKPVIATAFGGMPDFVEQGVTGLLVPVGDVDALAGAMHRLAADAVLRAEMGRRGRERYADRYHPEALVADIESIYAKVRVAP